MISELIGFMPKSTVCITVEEFDKLLEIAKASDVAKHEHSNLALQIDNAFVKPLRNAGMSQEMIKQILMGEIVLDIRRDEVMPGTYLVRLHK